jgi:hypothetical protein
MIKIISCAALMSVHSFIHSSSPHIAILISFLSTAFAVITTASATFLIALKIVLVTRRSYMQHSYTRIIRILIESAALLSISGLILAILDLVSYFNPYKLNTQTGRFLFQIFVCITYTQAPITVRVSLLLYMHLI